MTQLNDRAIDDEALRFLAGKQTRRQFIVRLTALGLTFGSIQAILAACSSQGAATPSASGGAPSASGGAPSASSGAPSASSGAPSGAAPGATIQYWGLSVSVPGKNWDAFTQQYKWKVNLQDNGAALGPVAAQLAAGTGKNWDVISLNEGAQNILAPQNYIVPVDISRVPLASKAFDYWPIHGDFKGTNLYKFNGQNYGIPIWGNGDSIAYLPDETGKIDSFGALFDPAFKGKTALENRATAPLTKTALYLKGNNLANIADAGDLATDELKIVTDFLTGKKRDGQFRVFWKTWDDALTLLKSKEVLVMDTWEPVVVALKDQGVNVEYAFPKEGFMFFVLANYLLKSGVDRGMEQAFYDLCNFQYDGYNGCQMSTLHHYMTPGSSTLEYATAHPSEFDPAKVKIDVDRSQKKINQGGGAFEPMSPLKVGLKAYLDAWTSVLNA